MQTGDEVSGQDKSFTKWAAEVFQAACEAFEVVDQVNVKTMLSDNAPVWTKASTRLAFVDDQVPEVMLNGILNLELNFQFWTLFF